MKVTHEHGHALVLDDEHEPYGIVAPLPDGTFEAIPRIGMPLTGAFPCVQDAADAVVAAVEEREAS